MNLQCDCNYRIDLVIKYFVKITPFSIQYILSLYTIAINITCSCTVFIFMKNEKHKGKVLKSNKTGTCANYQFFRQIIIFYTKSNKKRLKYISRYFCVECDKNFIITNQKVKVEDLPQ